MEELKEYYSILFELLTMYKEGKLHLNEYAEMLAYIDERKIEGYKGFIQDNGVFIIVKFFDKDNDLMGVVQVRNKTYVEPTYTLEEIMDKAKNEGLNISFKVPNIFDPFNTYCTDGYIVFKGTQSLNRYEYMDLRKRQHKYTISY